MASTFRERYLAGDIQLGTLQMGPAELLMRPLAQAGYTWFITDLMYGWNDWRDVHHLCVSARDAGVTTFIRIPAHPWKNRDIVDHRMTVDAARAVSLSPDGICFSANNAAEVREVASVLADWHRAGEVVESVEDLARLEASISQELILAATIESEGALEDMDEIIAVEGVSLVFISGTDLPRRLGFPFQYDHPEYYRYLARAVAVAEKHDVIVGTNTGYTFTGVEETVARMGRLIEAGVRVILTQTVEHMLYSHAKALAQGISMRQPGGRSPRA